MADYEVKNANVRYQFEEKINIEGMIEVSQYLNKKRNSLSLFIVIISLIYLLYLVIISINAENKDSYTGFIFTFGLSFILGCILLYKNSKKALRKAIISLNADIIDSLICYEFYDDFLVTKVSGKEMDVEKRMQYSFINYIGKTKKGIYYLVTKDRRILIIQSPEILAFIKAKINI